MLPPADLLLLSLLGLVLLGRRPRLGRALLLVGLLSLWLLCLPSWGMPSRGLPAAIRRLIWRDRTGASGGHSGRRRAAPLAPEYGAPASGPSLLERLAYGAYVARTPVCRFWSRGFTSRPSPCATPCSAISASRRAGWTRSPTIPSRTLATHAAAACRRYRAHPLGDACHA